MLRLILVYYTAFESWIVASRGFAFQNQMFAVYPTPSASKTSARYVHSKKLDASNDKPI